MHNKERISTILSCVFLVALLIVVVLFDRTMKNNREMRLFKDNNQPEAYLSAEWNGVQINATYNGYGVYLYLPSFLGNVETLYIDDTIRNITMNGETPGERWAFEYDVTYWCELKYEGEVIEFPFCVTRSNNVSAVFIETESGNMDYVWQDKENKESGRMTIFDANGYLSYDGNLEYIKGRGNSSWLNSEKVPYNISLSHKASILGMDAGKKWILLSNDMDASKLGNIMAHDMAKAFGLEAVFECEWIDLYLNNNYVGNYVICENLEVGLVDAKGQDLQEITSAMNPMPEVIEASVGTSKGIQVEKNPQNISGTYIIELDTLFYYQDEVSGFSTSDNNYFTVKSPKYASIEQTEYIKGIVQNIENLLMKSIDEYDGEVYGELFERLDMKSFAIQYFVDFFMGDCDMGLTSTFFYKKYNDDTLYSGPVWDYDKVFGMYENMVWDYHVDIIDMRIGLTWYEYLRENEEYQKYCKRFYEETVRPYILKLIERGIDEYAGKVKASYEMDTLCWNTYNRYYKTLENNVRYIKFYLNERIKFMDERYGIEGQCIEFLGDGSTHVITVLFEGEELIYEVLDGAFFTELWELDESKYFCWVEDESKYEFNEKLPILEDMVISALERE